MKSTAAALVACLLQAPLAPGADREGVVGKYLALSLETDEASVSERGVLALRLVALNVSDARTRTGLMVEPCYERDFQLFYRRVAEPSEPFVPLTYPPHWLDLPIAEPIAQLDLRPGERREFRMAVVVNPGRGEFLFAREGQYELKAVARLSWLKVPETIETPVLRVQVSRAMGSEVEVLRLWDLDLAYLAQVDGGYGGRRLFELLPRAVDLTQAYPDSKLSRALRHGILSALPSRDGGGAALTKEQRSAYETLRKAPE